MTECGSCGLSFSGTSAFDRHRVGKHAYTYSEGLRMEPLREDGRRCLHVSEMGGAGMEQDARGRWRLVPSEKQLAGLARMRQSAATKPQDATEALSPTPTRVTS